MSSIRFPDSDATRKLCAAGKPGCTWDHSKRRTTLNGQIVPVIKMRPGEVQRWRFSVEMAPLAPFPGVNLKDQAVGVQTAVYKLAQDLAPTGTRNYFQINGHAFHPSRIRYLKLGATDVWTVSTVGDSDAVPADKRIPPLPHVFHIHVNPFQVLRKNPAGQDEMVWRDTVLIPAGQTVNLYTQYLDYIGQFVMHCHILDHEDLGMMETAEVVGDQPLSSHGAHH